MQLRSAFLRDGDVTPNSPRTQSAGRLPGAPALNYDMPPTPLNNAHFGGFLLRAVTS